MLICRRYGVLITDNRFDDCMDKLPHIYYEIFLGMYEQTGSEYGQNSLLDI